jgi:hypothetical protein
MQVNIEREVWLVKGVEMEEWLRVVKWLVIMDMDMHVE